MNDEFAPSDGELNAESDSELYEDTKVIYLNESAKSALFEIKSIELFSRAITYPHNLKIGISARQDVLDVYPPSTAFVYESGGDNYRNEIIYNYNFRNEKGELPDEACGSVCYNFDESDILYSITVSWYSEE
jgi:hypothetical protein